MLETFWRDKRGEMNGAQSGVNVVVGLMVGGLVAAFLFPIAVSEIVAVDTSTWVDGAAELWKLLDVMLVLGVFLFFVQLALNRRGGGG